MLTKITEYVLESCVNFSQKVMDHVNLKTIDNAHIFFAGSVSRLEAMPMADLDLVCFSDKETIVLNCDELKVDRVDNIYIPNNDIAIQLLNHKSPEAGFLDCKSDKNLEHIFFKAFNNKQYLSDKLVWEFIFSRKFNDRSTASNINLKYTPGGYRDILFINLFARLIDGNIYPSQPEFIGSIFKLCSYFSRLPYSYNQIIESISLIILVKSIALELYKKTPSRGTTSLNSETIAKILYSSSLLCELSSSSENTFWKLYNNAKLIIRQIVDLIYLHITSEMENVLSPDTLLLLKWHKDNCPCDNAAILRKGYNTYPIASYLILNNHLSNNELMFFLEKNNGNAGHYYTNRLIAKIVSPGHEVLNYLHTHSRFAMDDLTNEKYIDLVNKKIKELSY